MEKFSRYGKNEWKRKGLNILFTFFILVILVFIFIVVYQIILPKYETHQKQQNEEAKARELKEQITKKTKKSNASKKNRKVTKQTKEEQKKSYVSEYEVVVSDFSWEEARADAESKGGHLAVITSEEEQKAIENLIDQNGGLHTVWLGGILDGDKIKWINGEETSYTKWGPGEPNNETGDEEYLDMYKKDNLWLWNDAPNNIEKYYSGKMGYIIEKKVEE